MPFKSEAQRRYLWMKHPEVAREFADATPKSQKGKKLPYHVPGSKSTYKPKRPYKPTRSKAAAGDPSMTLEQLLAAVAHDPVMPAGRLEIPDTMASPNVPKLPSVKQAQKCTVESVGQKRALASTKDPLKAAQELMSSMLSPQMRGVPSTNPPKPTKTAVSYGTDESYDWPAVGHCTTDARSFGNVPAGRLGIPDRSPLRLELPTDPVFRKLAAVLSPMLAELFGHEQTAKVPENIKGTYLDPEAEQAQANAPQAVNPAQSIMDSTMGGMLPNTGTAPPQAVPPNQMPTQPGVGPSGQFGGPAANPIDKHGPMGESGMGGLASMQHLNKSAGALGVRARP